MSTAQPLPATIDPFASLGPLRLARLRFRFQALEPLRLPRFKGSSFRGALGTALKRTLCLRHRFPACDDCRLMESCRYPELFETRWSSRRQERHSIPTPPFILIPPGTEQTDFEKGELFDCGLILVGYALDEASCFVRAFAEVGRRGLGRGRGTCRLTQIESLAPSDRDEGVRRLPGGLVEFSADRVIRDRSDWRSARRWRLEFLSPVRLQDNGHLVKSADFRLLAQRLSERIESLARLYGDGARLDIPLILQAASRIRLVEPRIWWDDWERYSNRQETRMRLGGFRGRATYAGDLNFFVPLLALGEWLNVGKGATFGLGRFRVEPLEEPE